MTQNTNITNTNTKNSENTNTISTSPPRAPPITYTAHHGTRWAKEKAAAPPGAFENVDDPAAVGPWIMGETVGKGASGRVKIARHRTTGQLAAVKILPIAPLLSARQGLDGKAREKAAKQRLGVDREITMMKLMDHPHILRIYDVFEDARSLYLVLEYVPGGELFDFLVNRGRLPPREAVVFFRQILAALAYAHAFRIIHRDLKPENILIASLEPPRIKIADWGMAAFAPPALQLETSCGSPHYASPEIVNGDRYEGTATDIWSLGVILYALLTGRLPFDDKDVRALLLKVKAGRYDVPAHIGPAARDLLARMLVVDVHTRITIPEILQHAWLNAPSQDPHAYVPPPPPAPSALARSVSRIDEDLMRGLLVIWGKNASRTALAAELLAPPGEGTLAKAFYFLLKLYRDRTVVEGVEEEGWLGGKQVTKQYTTPAAVSMAVSNPQPVVRTRARPQSTPMPEYAAYHRDRALASPNPNQPVSRRASASPPSQADARAPRSTVSVQPRAAVFRTREMMQSVGEPMVCDSSSPRFRHSTAPAQAAVSPHSVYAQVQRPQSARSQSARPQSVLSQSQDGSPMRVDPLQTQPLPMLRAPRVANQEFQRTVDELTEKVNTLARVKREGKENAGRQSQTQLRDLNQNQAPGNYKRASRASRIQEREKENTGTALGDGEEEFVHVHGAGPSMTNTPRIPFQGQQEPVHAYAPANFVLEVDQEQKDTKEKDGQGQAKKSRRARALTIDLPGTHLRRFALASPNPESPTTPSPAVGEFKGWFANLFNWKAQTCVLCSSTGAPATRAEVTRLLERRGVVVALEDGSVLRCRVDDGAENLKSTRFRVELHASLAAASAAQAGGSRSPLASPTGLGLKHGGAGGAQCVVVLTQEKGAVATFRAVCARLREEWTLDALQSPPGAQYLMETGESGKMFV
ncbi:hypothetical protein HWV62_21679 [Athelia sp. TMB]|nr:hypothetical protein HWV62_21679 [Athelia sp. TMB]